MHILKFLDFRKLYNRIIESFFNSNQINGYFIVYNHSESHDLELRIRERTDIKNDKEFKDILNKITMKLNYINIKEYIKKDLVFINTKAKIIVFINSNEKITIKTILDLSQLTKDKDKIIKI